jgi:hypothetical protein
MLFFDTELFTCPVVPPTTEVLATADLDVVENSDALLTNPDTAAFIDANKICDTTEEVLSVADLDVTENSDALLSNPDTAAFIDANKICDTTEEVLAVADLDVTANSDALLSNPDTAAFIDANKICDTTEEVLAVADLDVTANSDALLSNPDTAAFIDANKICDTTEEVLAVADLDVTANSDALLSNPDTAAFIDANKICDTTEEVLAVADLDVTANSDALLSNPDTAAFIDANKICDTTEEVLAVADLDVTANSDALLSNPDTAAFIDANKTCPTPLNTANPIKTGQTTSYASGDDGDLEEGRLTSFTALDFTNVFSNTNRFTDELGGQTYTNDIVIDWATYNQVAETVYGWIRTTSAANWANALTGAAATSISTFTTGWYLPNAKELYCLWNHGTIGGFNYAPFGHNIECWTSTTRPDNTLQAFSCFGPTGEFPIIRQTKTNSRAYMPTRLFTWNGSSLT